MNHMQVDLFSRLVETCKIAEDTVGRHASNAPVESGNRGTVSVNRPPFKRANPGRSIQSKSRSVAPTRSVDSCTNF